MIGSLIDSGMIHLAALALPRGVRSRYKRAWLAEVELLREESGGEARAFAWSLLYGVPRLRRVYRQRHQTRREARMRYITFATTTIAALVIMVTLRGVVPLPLFTPTPAGPPPPSYAPAPQAPSEVAPTPTLAPMARGNIESELPLPEEIDDVVAFSARLQSLEAESPLADMAYPEMGRGFDATGTPNPVGPVGPTGATGAFGPVGPLPSLMPKSRLEDGANLEQEGQPYEPYEIVLEEILKPLTALTPPTAQEAAKIAAVLQRFVEQYPEGEVQAMQQLLELLQ